jgi:hypothetical protein
MSAVEASHVKLRGFTCRRSRVLMSAVEGSHVLLCFGEISEAPVSEGTTRGNWCEKMCRYDTYLRSFLRFKSYEQRRRCCSSSSQSERNVVSSYPKQAVFIPRKKEVRPRLALPNLAFWSCASSMLPRVRVALAAFALRPQVMFRREPRA